MAKKALLVVDVGKDFCLGGALAVPGGDEVVEPINRLIEYADKNDMLVILIRDWHPPDSRHFEKWPRHCVAGTPGADFHPDLLVAGGPRVLLFKGIDPEEDGYSPWEGKIKLAIRLFRGGLLRSVDSIWPTLKELLKTAGVEEAYVCGLATEYCDKAAASGAIAEGFRTFLVLDACRAVKEEDGASAVKELESLGVIITSTEEILKG